MKIHGPHIGNRHNWRVSSNLLLAEYRGLLQRQHMAVHTIEKNPVCTKNEMILMKILMADSRILPGQKLQKQDIYIYIYIYIYSYKFKMGWKCFQDEKG